MTFRPYPLLSLLTAVSVVSLVMFGNWQWGKYDAKRASLDAPPELVTLEGRLLPGTVRQVYTLTDGKAAWRDVALVETADGAVFVPQTIHYGMDPPAAFVLEAPQFYASRGLWHTVKGRNAFSSADNPEAGQFYALDPGVLATGLPEDLAGRIEARVFEPEMLLRTDGPMAAPVDNPFLRPELDARLTPERHFGYAITWWGLAIALIGVYLALHHQRGRLRFSKTGDK